MSTKQFSVEELEEMLKDMARQVEGQKDKHIPQIQIDHLTKTGGKVRVKNLPQKKLRKGSQKGS